MLSATTKYSQLNKNILLSASIKAFNILCVFIIVRRSVALLGVENYGIWTAIASISMWVSLLDVGVGNGLRVELRRCFINEQWTEARRLLNTAYIFIGSLSLVIISVFLVIWFNVDWTALFNIKNYSVTNINILILITFIGLVLQLVFSLIAPVLNANLHSGLENIFLTISNAFILCYLTFSTPETIDLVQYAFLSAFLPVFAYIGFSLFYFKKYLPQLMPDLKDTDFKAIKPIFLVSGKFFFMQISAVIMYEMTTFLLIRYFSPNEVAEYNIAYRYFNLFYIVFMTLLSPLWSLTTDAYLRGDVQWIINTMKKYAVLLVFIFGALIVGYFVRDIAFNFWLKDVVVSSKIAFYVAVYMAILSWNSLFLYVVTGAGKIHVQFVLAIINIILFLPMTHFFVKVLHWGIDGIFIGNMVILLFTSVCIPLQTYMLLKTDKKGIWTKE
jgi:O-antigen/teichoic acid export membrane protein